MAIAGILRRFGELFRRKKSLEVGVDDRWKLRTKPKKPKELEEELYANEQVIHDRKGQVLRVEDLKLTEEYVWVSGKNQHKSSVRVIEVSMDRRTLKIHSLRTGIEVEHCFADFGLEAYLFGNYKNKWNRYNYLLRR